MATVMAEASKYYANLIMPFGNLVLGALDKLKREKIEMIATSHGIVWRSHLSQILDAYARWARSETRPKALVIYDTMWGSTEKMAQALVDSIAAEGIEVKLCNLTLSNRSDVITEVLESKVLLLGSPTLNNGPLPTMAAFLSYLEGLKPKGKLAAAFSSYGWGGGAKKAIEENLLQIGVEVIPSDLEFKFVPTVEELERCTAFGKEVVTKIRETVRL
jgi:flavorubredoxin